MVQAALEKPYTKIRKKQQNGKQNTGNNTLRGICTLTLNINELKKQNLLSVVYIKLSFKDRHHHFKIKDWKMYSK